MRHKKTPKRNIKADPKFNSIQLSKFINTLMYDGKKAIAQKVVYDALEIIEEKDTEKTPGGAIEVFVKAIKNVGPTIETRSKRVAGANYQIPQTVRPERRQSLAFRWILTATRSKKGAPMAQKLANELLLAANNEGDAVKKKLDVQKMAEANRAFAHFAR